MNMYNINEVILTIMNVEPIYSLFANKKFETALNVAQFTSGISLNNTELEYALQELEEEHAEEF